MTEKGMTVSEVIEYLRTLDQNMECFFRIEEDLYDPVTTEQLKIMTLLDADTLGDERTVVILGDSP